MDDQDDSSSGEDLPENYASTLRGYVDRPTDAGLAAAYELGRSALGAGYSMLELVAIHLEHRRKLVEDKGVARLRDMDDFLSEALSSFEVTQRGFVESQDAAAAERAQAEWLGSLTDMYLAIASHATLDGRLEEVCEQAKRFLGAADARVSFGRRIEGEAVGVDSITVRLRGGGRLTVTAPAGQSWSDHDRMALKQFAVLVSAPVDDARRLQFSERIGRLGRLLGGPSDPDAIVARLDHRGAEAIGADWMMIALGADGGTVRSELRESIDAVTRTGETQFHAESADEPSSAWAALPLSGSDENLGVLVVGFEETQPFDEVQRSFLSDVGRRVTAALERSIAYARERASRRDAEVASAQLRHLEELASELGRALTRRRAAQLLLGRAVASTSARGGLVVVANERSGSAEVLAANGAFRDRHDQLIDELDPVLHPTSVDAGADVTTFSLDDLTSTASQHLESLGVRAVSRYPILVGPAEVISLVVAWSESGGAGGADDELLRAQVGIAGPNVKRAERYDAEHDIADTLQRTMLEVPPLSMPGLLWAAYYRAGSAGLAGGDWYDLVAVDDHRVGIVVGDIVGRGIQAAASMGQLRSATRALAGLVTDPANLLSELDKFASNTRHGRHSSLAYALLDTDSGVIAVSLAGHPPPVLRFPDRTAALFEGGRGPLLGFESRRASKIQRLDPGTQVVFYTDGLVERREETLDVGLRRLVENVASLDTLQPADVCQVLIDLMGPRDAETRRDDIAVVAVEYCGP